MWTDNSERGRFALQPATPDESELLALVAVGIEQVGAVRRAYWTSEVDEFPGLSHLRWHETDDDDRGASALVVEYDTEAAA